MKKSVLIAKANLKKTKGQAVTIIVLTLLASMLLNIWLMLSMDYKQNFNRYHNKLHAEDVVVSVDRTNDRMLDFLEEKFSLEEEIEEYELTTTYQMVTSFDINNGSLNTCVFYINESSVLNKSIGKTEFVKRDASYTSGIFLPMIYETKTTSIGNEITLTIGSHKVTYTICGFFNNLMYGSHNCGLCMFILTDDKYEEFSRERYANESILCSIRLADGVKSDEYESSIMRVISTAAPSALVYSNSYSLVAQSRYVSQLICTSIVSAMAIIVILIAVVVIASNIANYIRENMKTIGVLKATGYTTGQLVLSFMVQFLSLAVIAVATGIGFSYGLFPLINGMMISQTGIPYAIHFLFVPCLITILSVTAFVALAVYISTRRIKRIEPITALRSGIETHSFKRNHVPLKKTKLPLNLLLAIKTTCFNIKQNITIFITMIALSLVAVFCTTCVKNVVSNQTLFINMIAGEAADGCINIEARAEADFINRLNRDDRAEKFYLYHSETVQHIDGVQLTATISDDYEKTNNQDIVYAGRYPKFDNEIVIAGKYAKEKGIKLGSNFAISSFGKEATYIVSGFSQQTNTLGKDCFLTLDGFLELGELTNMTYYYDLIEGEDIDAFNKEYQELYGAMINTAINIDSVLNAGAAVYVSLMTLIVVAVLILSILIIAFVLYLLVKNLISNKKKDYGILKSLGFTTKQLVIQTALSFMPAIIISTVIGLIVSSFLINPLMSLLLGGIGIVKCTFVIPIGLTIGAGGLLILVSFVLACLVSIRIKHISAKSLLVNE